MKRLKLNFARYTDANLLILAQAILAALTGNAFFPSPTPTLTIFQAAITAYSDALTAAKDGGKTNVTIKNARRLNLVALMVQMGNYVMLTANGNLEMLGTCSIPLSKDREPMPPLGKPVIIKIEDGVNSGDALVTIATLMGSRNFQYQATPDPLTPDSEWIGTSCTQRKCTLSGLEPGKIYWFRVIAYGIKEQVVYGDAVRSQIIR